MAQEPENEVDKDTPTLPDELDRALEELCEFYEIGSDYDIEHKGVSVDELIFRITFDNDTEVDNLLQLLTDLKDHPAVSEICDISFTAGTNCTIDLACNE